MRASRSAKAPGHSTPAAAEAAPFIAPRSHRADLRLSRCHQATISEKSTRPLESLPDWVWEVQRSASSGQGRERHGPSRSSWVAWREWDRLARGQRQQQEKAVNAGEEETGDGRERIRQWGWGIEKGGRVPRRSLGDWPGAENSPS